MRVTGDAVAKGGTVVVSLSQRNIRELYHFTQAAQYGSAGDLPYLVKVKNGQRLVVQVERDDVHYPRVNSNDAATEIE